MGTLGADKVVAEEDTSECTWGSSLVHMDCTYSSEDLDCMGCKGCKDCMDYKDCMSLGHRDHTVHIPLQVCKDCMDCMVHMDCKVHTVYRLETESLAV